MTKKYIEIDFFYTFQPVYYCTRELVFNDKFLKKEIKKATGASHKHR